MTRMINRGLQSIGLVLIGFHEKVLHGGANIKGVFIIPWLVGRPRPIMPA